MYDIDLTPDFSDETPVKHNEISFQTHEGIRLDKSMSKSELADKLGISSRTLQRWINKIGADKIPGYRRDDKILTPGVLKILSERLCI